MKVDFGQFKSFIEVLTLITTIALTVFGFTTHQHMVQIITLSATSLFFIIYFTYLLIKAYKKKKLDDRSMSNSSIVKRSEIHCNSLYKFSLVIRKKLYKNKDYSALSKDKVQEQMILDKLKSNKKDIKKANKLNEKLNKLKLKFTSKATQEVINNLNNDQSMKAAQVFVKIFKDLERPLLNAEQFDLRIKFGKFIIDFSNDEYEKIRSYIDFLGWSYFMLGKTKLGIESIEKGIQRAQNIYEKMDDKTHEQESLYYITRGYRHLGSSRDIYENSPKKALEYLAQAELHFEKLDITFFETDKDKLERYNEMKIGISYGILLAKYFEFINKSKEVTASRQSFETLNKDFKDIDKLILESSKFLNQHRYVKLLLLKSKYLNLLLLDDIESNELELIKASLQSVNKVFKRNIFTDEAVEYYLEESVNQVKHELIKQLSCIEKGA